MIIGITIENSSLINPSNDRIQKALYCFKALMAAGTDANALKKHGCTALMLAAGWNPFDCYSRETLKALIAQGADVNAQDTRGMTTLMIVCNHHYGGGNLLALSDNGFINEFEYEPTDMFMLKALIAVKGIDVNARNREGKTALMFAAVHGYTRMVQTLIAAGADANAGTRKSALIFATQGRHVHTVNALITAKAIDINKVDGQGKTALMVAAKSGCTRAVEALVTGGADVNAVDFKGNTALKFAAVHGYPKMAQALMAAGASLTPVDEKKNLGIKS